MDLESAIEDAIEELEAKDIQQIQVETAIKWCGRAIAAQSLGKEEREITEYAHEAIEHAALSDDETLFFVRDTLRDYGILV